MFRLKGSGWYETDFKSDKENKRNLAGAERDEAKSDDKKDAPKKAEPAKTEAPKAEAAKPAAAKAGGDAAAAGRSRRSSGSGARAPARTKAPPRQRRRSRVAEGAPVGVAGRADSPVSLAAPFPAAPAALERFVARERERFRAANPRSAALAGARRAPLARRRADALDDATGARRFRCSWPRPRARR